MTLSEHGLKNHGGLTQSQQQRVTWQPMTSPLDYPDDHIGWELLMDDLADTSSSRFFGPSHQNCPVFTPREKAIVYLRNHGWSIYEIARITRLTHSGVFDVMQRLHGKKCRCLSFTYTSQRDE